MVIVWDRGEGIDGGIVLVGIELIIKLNGISRVTRRF